MKCFARIQFKIVQTLTVFENDSFLLWRSSPKVYTIFHVVQFFTIFLQRYALFRGKGIPIIQIYYSREAILYLRSEFICSLEDTFILTQSTYQD